MTELSPEQRDALHQLAAEQSCGVFDGRALRDLRERGIATSSADGWELTELGERAVDRTVEV